MCIILSNHFSNSSSFYVTCVCNHCHWTSLNPRSKMGLTRHLSCFYQVFSFYLVSFSVMMSLTIISSMTSPTVIFPGPGHLVRALFHFSKNSVGRVSGLFPFNWVIGIFSFSRVIEIFSFTRVIGIFSFSRVNGIFSSCQFKYFRVKSCWVNWIFSRSKTFLVSNSEFLI